MIQRQTFWRVAVFLFILSGLSGCKAAPHPNSAEATNDDVRFFIERETTSGYMQAELERTRFIGEGDRYRIDRMKRHQDRSAFEYAWVPPEAALSLRDELLALGVLTLGDAPEGKTTASYHYHAAYLVQFGGRANQFDNAAGDSVAHTRITVLLSDAVERYIDIPAYAEQIRNAEGPTQAHQAIDKLLQETEPEAAYGWFPIDVLLHTNLFTPGNGYHNYGNIAKLGVRVGPEIVPELLKRLPEAGPMQREITYDVLQLLLMQTISMRNDASAVMPWAERDPELAARTAAVIRDTFAQGPLRARLVEDNRVGHPADHTDSRGASCRLLLTLGDPASIQAVLDAIRMSAITVDWTFEAIYRYDAYFVGTRQTGRALLQSLDQETDDRVIRQLLLALSHWTRSAAQQRNGVGPDDERFSQELVAVVQPMLSNPELRLRANWLLKYYAKFVRPAAAERSLLSIEAPDGNEDDTSESQIWAAIELLENMGPGGLAVLHQRINHPTLGDAIALRLADPKQPELMGRLCQIARTPGWIDGHLIAWRFGKLKDPRTVEALLGMLGDPLLSEDQSAVANALGSVTQQWDIRGDDDDAVLRQWLDWWEANREAYPDQYVATR